MKILKKLMTMIGIVSVLTVSMMLTACPPAGQQTATEPQISDSDANNAASGISANVTVKGTIDDTTCDIELNASTGTFEAVESRADAIFTGEFFYNDGKLSLKVQYKNTEPFGKCYEATATLTANATISLTEISEDNYKSGKNAFIASVSSDINNMLKQIDDSLANTKVEVTKVSGGLSVKAFNKTFTIKMEDMSMAIDDNTPSWFIVINTYINNLMSLSGGTGSSAPMTPDQLKGAINLAFGNYKNIAKAVNDLFDVLFNGTGDATNDKEVLDAAEAELSKYLPDGIKFSIKAAGDHFVPFMILGNETDSNYQEYCFAANTEPVPPEWLINLMSSFGNSINPNTSADSPIITGLKDKYPGVAKMLTEYINLLKNGNPLSVVFEQYFGDVTADLAKGEAYLNGKTFDVTIDTTATAGAVIKIAINGTSATDKSEWTITPEGTGVISDSAPGWFKAVFPKVVGAINATSNGDFGYGINTVASALQQSSYSRLAQLMNYIFTIAYQASNNDNPLAEYADELAAAEAVLGNYANSNMTAVMTSDGLQITIGGEGTNKIEFLYIPTETTQSSDVPEWFVNLYPVISTLMDGTSGDNTAAAAMNYLMQNYPGMAKLTQAIAATMQGIMENAIKVYYDNNVIYSFGNTDLEIAQGVLDSIGLTTADYTVAADGKNITLTNSQAYENFMNAMNGSNNPTVLGAVISYTTNDSTVNWTDISFDTKEAAESALAELGLNIEAGDYTESQKSGADNNGIIICFILTDSGYQKYIASQNGNNNGGSTGAKVSVTITYTSTDFQPQTFDTTADAYAEMAKWGVTGEDLEYTVDTTTDDNGTVVSITLTEEGYEKYTEYMSVQQINEFIYKKAQNLAAAQDALANCTGDMTADLTTDLNNNTVINVTIGDDISFTLIPATGGTISVSEDAPQWFTGIFQDIYSLTPQIAFEKIAAALNTDYAGVGELIGVIGTQIEKLY